jgi:DNA repair exonuclease SbcCD ATPase subunit
LKQEKENRAKLEEIKGLNDFIKFLQESRVTFLSQIWGNILAVASGFLMRATNGIVTALTKSDKEGFMFCEDGVYAPIASASGAQKGFIGVAVRIGLAKSLRGSSELVVLDEPTESMREEHALRLSGSLLGQGQILMVTHRESDKVSASNVIEV